jgi:Uma2 family endonuclease
MSTERAPARLTYDDLQRLPDDGLRHELVDGVLVVTPAPGVRHQRILLEIAIQLQAAARSGSLGDVLIAPVDVRLSDVNVVEPDLLFVAREGRASVGERCVEGPPELVVEVLSPSSRRTDAVVKRQLYERHEVLEYWLVDPESDSVRVYRRNEQRLEQTAEFSVAAGDVLTTSLLPGLELRLAEVFAL